MENRDKVVLLSHTKLHSYYESMLQSSNFFTKVLEMQLEIEPEGLEWTSLSAILTMSPSTSLIQFAMTNRLCLKDLANKRVVRYWDIHVHPSGPWMATCCTLY